MEQAPWPPVSRILRQMDGRGGRADMQKPELPPQGCYGFGIRQSP
jgi:hypothetical protein